MQSKSRQIGRLLLLLFLRKTYLRIYTLKDECLPFFKVALHREQDS